MPYVVQVPYNVFVPVKEVPLYVIKFNKKTPQRILRKYQIHMFKRMGTILLHAYNTISGTEIVSNDVHSTGRLYFLIYMISQPLSLYAGRRVRHGRDLPDVGRRPSLQEAENHGPEPTRE